MTFHFSTDQTISSHEDNHCAQPLTIQGNVHSKTDLYITGRIQGNVDCEACVYIGSLGDVSGYVHTRRAVVCGHIQGDLRASEIAAISDTAQIEGQVQAKKIIAMYSPQLPKDLQLS